jgi:hypothetical protein
MYKSVLGKINKLQKKKLVKPALVIVTTSIKLVKPALVTTSIKLVKPALVTTSIKLVKPALVTLC